MVNRPKNKGSRLPIGDRLLSRSRQLKTGCLVYMGYVHGESGYGQISFEGRRYQTHRLSWELAHGPIPEGLVVLHSCDVPSCFNVDHLSLGTHADNVRDKVSKGRARGATGETNGNAKLSTEQVRKIRGAYVKGSRRGSGTSASDVAEQYGITPQYVYQLSMGMTRSSR